MCTAMLYVYCNAIYNFQEIKTIWVSIVWWADKETVITDNGKVFCKIKNKSCHWNKRGGIKWHYGKRNEADTKKISTWSQTYVESKKCSHVNWEKSGGYMRVSKDRWWMLNDCELSYP